MENEVLNGYETLARERAGAEKPETSKSLKSTSTLLAEVTRNLLTMLGAQVDVEMKKQATDRDPDLIRILITNAVKLASIDPETKHRIKKGKELADEEEEPEADVDYAKLVESVVTKMTEQKS